MAVRLNEDKEIVKAIREGLKRTGGIAPAVWNGRKRISVCARSSGSRSPIPTTRDIVIVCSIIRIESCKIPEKRLTNFT